MREPGVYGIVTLSEIDIRLKELADQEKVGIEILQSNHEGVLVDVIQSSPTKHQGIVMNAAAYTHTSIAIRDAIAAVQIPAVEVHLSNIYRREEFRHHSYLAPVTIGQISGFGANSYYLGFQAIVTYLRQSPEGKVKKDKS
jgi:3-dehydroquinate dehydratase-2